MSRNYDNPVDHKYDLGLVNYIRHPENADYVVFRLGDEDRANYFQELLEKENIWFERSHEDTKQRRYHLFGVHKQDFQRVQRVNFTVEGKHRKHFISVGWLRYFLIFFSVFVMVLAVIGYYKAQQKLASYDEPDVLVNPSE